MSQREEAKKLFDAGLSLVDIAEKLGTKPATVRCWKARGKWPERDKPQRNATRKRNVTSKEVESVIANSSLTPKQQLFCLHYSKSFNATRSYQKVYECDYLTACANGSRLLANAKIRDEIIKIKELRYSESILKPEDIFQKYMDIAFSDISDYLEWGQSEVQVMAMYGPVFVKNEVTGEKVPLKKMVNSVRFRDSGEVDGTILSEVKQGKDGASIKLADRMKALDWLADHMNMATEEQKARIDQIKASTKAIADPSQNRRTVIKYDI